MSYVIEYLDDCNVEEYARVDNVNSEQAALAAFYAKAHLLAVEEVRNVHLVN